MTHIRYAGVVYPLPAITGTYLCDAIQTALLDGRSFFVELGAARSDPEMQRSIFVSPSTPIELSRLALDVATYRGEILDAFLELIDLPGHHMYFLGAETGEDDVDEFAAMMRAAVAELRDPAVDPDRA